MYRFKNISVFHSPLYLISFTLLCLTKLVKAKQCRYYYDNGDEKYFHCSIYEFCCGVACCRSSAITFYQMWYFWLMVFLTILFCSGGGWWYRLRNHEFSHTRGPQVLPQRITVYAGPVRTQPYPPGSIPVAIPMQNTAQYQYPPPPPYYGPPPSYDTVVNQVPPARQG